MSAELTLFSQFAKGRKKSKANGGNCVIYTRVSTKEQADNNFSLDTQKRACEQYAKKQGYSVVGYFGGTYESAKTDERKEFNNMLNFVKKSSDKVSCIIVYSVDRFSRSGANAIYIAEQLKKQGIVVCSVTQPADATTASGSLQQNIQFIFSEYDNQQRREKCMSGTRESLLRGEWCTAPPTGYDIVKTNGKKEILVNAKGRLLRKAFYWKAHDKLTTEEIRRKLAALGLKLSSQRMSEILRNPFYCGLIVHNMLEGQVVEGKHEKLISHELFLQVNGVLSENKQGYRTKPENKDIPLKRFMKCEYCGGYLRAYKAYKNQEYYYKCNNSGCNCNRRADKVHEFFLEKLMENVLNVNDDSRYLISEQMVATFNQLSAQVETDRNHLKGQVDEINKKLHRLEERFILEEISKPMFEKYNAIFLEEKKKIEDEMSQSTVRVSNLEECVDYVLLTSAKLATAWDSSDYKRRQDLQFLVFPEGMKYDRKKDECRTEKVDEIFEYMTRLNRVLREKENGNCKENLQFPPFVVSAGIEPLFL